jgi:hypothetical protein
MKRDMDLIRKIMLVVEDSDGQADLSPLLADGYTERQLTGHAALIFKAGLAERMSDEQGLDGDCFCILTGLTWAGHDFISNAKSDRVWNQAKSKVLETAGGLSLDAMKTALAFYAQQALKATLGIP